MRVALTIAGSDPCAGAGIQADLKTFHANSVYGLSVITAITVQNTEKVFNIHKVPSEIVYDQIIKLFEDMPIDAVKIGMLASEAIIEAVADALLKVHAKNVVLDPVMISKSGYHLTASSTIKKMTEKLFPLIDVITPNLDEAEVFTQSSLKNIDEIKKSAKKIHEMGVKNIAMKGGHFNSDQATDTLYNGKEYMILKDNWVDTKNSHGTGCTYSSALASSLSKGRSFFQSAKDAKIFIIESLKTSITLGRGSGPLNHFHKQVSYF